MKRAKRPNKLLIVKFGTESLSKNGELSRRIFNSAARQIAQLQKENIATIIVSSGAIRAGREILKELGNTSDKLDKKRIAGVGSSVLMEKWRRAFEKHKIATAQFWVTYANWMHGNERQNVRLGLLECCQCGIVPVVNENDIISDEEIKKMEMGFSENDELAKMIAGLVNADFVMFVTTAGGIFNKEPGNSRAKRYKTIDETEIGKILSLQNKKSDAGTGGIHAKIKWALECHRPGTKVCVAGMKEKNSILKFVRGETVGTLLDKQASFY